MQAHNGDDTGEWPLSFGFLFDDHHEQLSDEYTIDLDADGILTFSPEIVQGQVLFEEKFNHPTVSVNKCHLTGRYFKVVGHEVIYLSVVGLEGDPAQLEFL